MDYIFNDVDPCDVERIANLAKRAFKTYGIAIFPKLFSKDENFLTYLNDLHWMFDYVSTINNFSTNRKDLGDRLFDLHTINSIDGKIITNLGTQPNKFNSFNMLKYCTQIQIILQSVFENSQLQNKRHAPIMTPQAGDTLHFFAPGKTFFKYNLPNHQDYPYLMQSQNQVTCYLGLSKYHEGVGGLGYFPCSNTLGLVEHKKNINGAFEITESSIVDKFSYDEFHWNVGDFAIFDSLLVHRSIPNLTSNRGRIVQIFRFSSLLSSRPSKYHFQSTSYPRPSVQFEEQHPDFYSES